MNDHFEQMELNDWEDYQDEGPKETCLLCGCIIGEEVGVGLRNPDGSGRAWCDLCYPNQESFLKQDRPSA
jgi:hypothetical protein